MKSKFLGLLLIFFIIVMPVNALTLEEVNDENFSIYEYDQREVADFFNVSVNIVDNFDELDYNNDSKIDIDEFEGLIDILAEDSFWDGYSLEEILISEFERFDSNHDDYINFEEFCEI